MVVSHADNKPVAVENDMECRARDGVILRADVYHPQDGGKYPVLLCRTPYDKLTPRYVSDARALATRGYTVVIQDHRGRYASGGEFTWMFRDKSETHDAEDGYDAVEWAARLPWSDGRVGTWGHSNASWAIWLLFSTQPPSLAAGLASGMCQKLLDLNFGIFETGRRLEWTYMMAADARRRAGEPLGPHTPAEATRRWNEVERGKYVWWLPLGSIPGEVFSTLNEQLQAYHRAQNVEFMNFSEIHEKVNVPTLQITGWWDRLIGTVDNFEGLTKNGKGFPLPAGEGLSGKARRGDGEAGSSSKLSASQDPPSNSLPGGGGRTADPRTLHRLIIGPWGHDPTQFSRKIGPVDYGPGADRPYYSMIARWYDYQFKGYDNGMAEEAPVQLFVLGENKWRGENEWPLARTVYTPFYLHSGGSANTVRGDGSLSTEAPGGGEAPSDEYIYDPRDPVMSLMRADAQAAPVDQSPHDHRQDILFYETPTLTEELELTGPVRLKLWARTDAPDTDWAAKLAVVFEDGFVMNLTYGIMRAQYRNGYENPELLQPGEIYEYEIKLNPIGVLLKPGQKLRLYVTSSDFPNFDRNHNTGKPYWEDTELRAARQAVFHTAEMPSCLLLPVIPR